MCYSNNQKQIKMNFEEKTKAILLGKLAAYDEMIKDYEDCICNSDLSHLRVFYHEKQLQMITKKELVIELINELKIK